MERGESSEYSQGPRGTLGELKDSQFFIWPMYCAIFLPMAMYAANDVIDSRWRHRRYSISSYRVYYAASFISYLVSPFYFWVQVVGDNPDHKEAATTVIAICVNLVTIMKLYHGFLALETTTILAQRFRLARPSQPCRSKHIFAYGEYVGDLVEKNALCLLNDESYGDGASVAWLRIIFARLQLRHWHKLPVHTRQSDGWLVRVMEAPVLQDANDLIIMAVAWVWGCLSQVPPYEGTGRSGTHTLPSTQQLLPNNEQLWHLIFMLDRAAVMGFSFLCNGQHGRGRDMTDTCGTLDENDFLSYVHKQVAEEFSPTPYCRKGEHRWGGNIGLSNLYDVFPGVQEILHRCFPSSLREVPDMTWVQRVSPLNLLARRAFTAYGLNLEDKTRNEWFQQAAAVRVTVHLLWAAVSSFTSVSATPSMQEIDVDNPQKLVDLVLADVRQLKSGSETARTAGGLLHVPGRMTDKDSMYIHGGQLSDWQLRHLLCLEERLEVDTLLQEPVREDLCNRVRSWRADPREAHEYFRILSLLRDGINAASLPEFSTPWLAAHACSIFSLITSTSRALQQEVDGKVANLPAMKLHRSIGSARLALIGIADWHRQLSRISRHKITMCTGQTTASHDRSPSRKPFMALQLDDACAAVVMGMDRLILHARYMGDSTRYMHERSVAAIVKPNGPLNEHEEGQVKQLLKFFMDVPQTMFHDCLDACSPGDESASLSEVIRGMPDSESANISLAMAAAFASVMTSTGTCLPGSAQSDHEPPPSHSASPNRYPFDCAIYYRRVLLALHHATCTAWEYITMKVCHARQKQDAALPSSVLKAWGILQPPCGHAAFAIATAFDEPEVGRYFARIAQEHVQLYLNDIQNKALAALHSAAAVTSTAHAARAAAVAAAKAGEVQDPDMPVSGPAAVAGNSNAAAGTQDTASLSRVIEALQQPPHLLRRDLRTMEQAITQIHTSGHLNDSLRHRDSSAYHAHRLVRILQLATETPLADPAMSQPLGCLANLSNRELVDAALEAAEWAEALELARESDLAALASFWAASLHTAMARRACNDAQQVVDLGENFPEFRLVPFQLMQPEQERMREDFEACQQTFHRATMNDMARREWIQEFANQSLKHAETCVWMGWSVLLRRTMQDDGSNRFITAMHYSHNAAALALDVAKAAAKHYTLQGAPYSRSPSPIEGDIARHLCPLAAASAMSNKHCTRRPTVSGPSSAADPGLDADADTGANSAPQAGPAPEAQADAESDPDPLLRMLACMHEDGLGVGFRLWQLLRQLLQHYIEPGGVQPGGQHQEGSAGHGHLQR